MSRVRDRLGVPRLTIVEPFARRWDKLPVWGKCLVLAAVLAFCIWYPTTLSRGWQGVLFYPVGIYILLALGLNVVVGRTGMLDLGYVAFFAVGAYSTAKLTANDIGGGLGTFTPWEVVLLAVILAMAAGVTLGAPTLRLRGDYLAIVTLGFGEIVRIVALNSASLGEARGIRNIPHPSSLPGLDFGIKPLPYVYLVLAGIIVAIILIRQLERSRVGRAWTAIREDEDAAELMGVPTFKMKLWSFAIGASTGGLAGWIFASKVGFVNPDTFPLNLSFLILAAVVLGGLGSTAGVIAGAFAVAFVPEYFREIAFGEDLLDFLNRVVGGEASDIIEYRYFLFGLALVAMMIFRPQGLLPSRQRAAELAEATGDRGMGAVAPVDGADVVADLAAAPGEASLEVPTDVELPDDFVTRATEVQEEVLVLDDVVMQFGGVVALNGVSLTVHRGQIFGVIGPNGAGKTTLFNCITGVYSASSGEVRLEGISLLGKAPHRITEAGIARTFQNIRLFPNMTAMENVMVGTDARHTTSVPGALVSSPKRNREERLGHAEAQRLLEFMGIGHRGDAVARNLPYGDQRRLEIARAIATQPKVLLLDEPAAGFNPAEKRALVTLIRQIRDAGLTVVLIEHDMELVMEVCDRIAVIDFGEKIAEGPPAEIQSDERVIQAYLGVADDAP